MSVWFGEIALRTRPYWALPSAAGIDGTEKEFSLVRKFWSGLIVLGAIATPRAPLAASANADLERGFVQTVRPFLNTYCITCHGGSAPASHFDLSAYSTAGSVVRDYAQWERVLDKLTTGQMPPKPMKQPSAAERQGVVAWIQAMRVG